MPNKNTCQMNTGRSMHNLSDEDIYHMLMMYQYQKTSSEKLARKFGITTAQVRDIIARRVNSGCCG